MSDFKDDLKFALDLDMKDNLSQYRNLFSIPKDSTGKEFAYFTGNSLGLQPLKAREYIDQELDAWAELGVEGHFNKKFPWMPYHEFVAKNLAKVVGAKESEVVAMNSLTVNLHLLMISFYKPAKEKYKIIIESNPFPSDIYAVESQLKLHGFEDGILKIPSTKGSLYTNNENILEFIEEHADETALILLPGVNYLSGQAFPMKEISKLAQKYDIAVGFDLAHAAGNIPLELHEWNVDFAVWCSYKYLNSGPGGIAGAFVHEKHHQKNLLRLQGWWGHDKATRFTMGEKYVPIPTAESWALSNPPIFQLASLRASLDIFSQVSMTVLRKKSEKLTCYLEFLLKKNKNIKILTPEDPSMRGAQISFTMEGIDENIIKDFRRKRVMADFRHPNIIRVAPVPLYNSFEDVYYLGNVLKDIYNG